MFYCADGSIYVNEIAPRPHNSGKNTKKKKTILIVYL